MGAVEVAQGQLRGSWQSRGAVVGFGGLEGAAGGLGAVGGTSEPSAFPSAVP